MTRFLIEVSQASQSLTEKRINDAIRSIGSHFATHANWSRENGRCSGTMIVEANDKWGALGVVPPGIHRVVSGEGQQGDRYSVVQFAHPTPWTVLAPVPTCVTPETPLRYPTISAADALDKVLWEINLVEEGRRLDSA